MSKKIVFYYWMSLVMLFCLSFTVCAWSAISKKVYNSASVIYLHSNGETPSLTDVEYTPDGESVVLPIGSSVCMARGKTSSVDNVFALKATFRNTEIFLVWSPVVRYTDLDIFDADATASRVKYVVYYTETRGSNYVQIPSSPFDSQTLSCTHTIGSNSPTYYYTMVAVDDMDNTSKFAIETDKFDNKFVYPSQSETMTYLTIPAEAATALYLGEKGNVGDNIYVDAIKNSDEDGRQAIVSNVKGKIVKSVSFNAYRYTNRKQFSSFSFPSAVQVVINYDVENGKVKNTVLPLDKAKERLGLYFYNGAEWLKIPSEIDIANRTITANVDHLSKYAIIAGAINPDKLTLAYRIPAIFTPNGDGKNDYVFFSYDNPAKKSPVKLRIFDLSGALVREIDEQSAGQIAGKMKWNGKDADNNLMESGIYVYQIQAGTDEFISGSFVLAK